MTKHDELVALLTEIRDRLPIDDATNARYEREDAEARQDEPDEALWEEWERLCRNAEAERDEALAEVECRAKRAESDLADMTRQRDALGRMADHNHDVAAKVKAERDAWRAKYAALRADVEDARRNPETLTRLLMRIADVLDRDDERAKGEQR